MKTEFYPISSIADWKTREPLDDVKWPLDISVIPNYMGINLSSVEGMSWTRQDDGQLVSLTIHFIPATEAEIKEQGGLRPLNN